jgi:hypothetical protein
MLAAALRSNADARLGAGEHTGAVKAPQAATGALRRRRTASPVLGRPNAPVQRWAAKRTVRCNRLLAVLKLLFLHVFEF